MIAPQSSSFTTFFLSPKSRIKDSSVEAQPSISKPSQETEDKLRRMIEAQADEHKKALATLEKKLRTQNKNISHQLKEVESTRRRENETNQVTRNADIAKLVKDGKRKEQPAPSAEASKVRWCFVCSMCVFPAMLTNKLKKKKRKKEESSKEDLDANNVSGCQSISRGAIPMCIRSINIAPLRNWHRGRRNRRLRRPIR